MLAHASVHQRSKHLTDPVGGRTGNQVSGLLSPVGHILRPGLQQRSISSPKTVQGEGLNAELCGLGRLGWSFYSVTMATAIFNLLQSK